MMMDEMIDEMMDGDGIKIDISVLRYPKPFWTLERSPR